MVLLSPFDSITQYGAMLYNIGKYYTIWENAVQYWTILYNIEQYQGGEINLKI